jgi:hypothetical protein
LVSKVGARRDASGGVLRYDRPAELRQGIEDNLRSLAVDHLTVVNLRLMDGAPPGRTSMTSSPPWWQRARTA